MSLITVDDMRERLLPLDTVREALAATEPLSTRSFRVGDDIRFLLDPAWSHGFEAKLGNDPVDAAVVIDGSEHLLTKDALLEFTTLCGVRRNFVTGPAELMEAHLNHWWRTGLAERRGGTRDYQILTAGERVAALTRASITPFSNVRILNEILDGLTAQYGSEEILVDYKFVHDLKRTHVRLIVPQRGRTIAGRDNWSVGVQFKNSLIGEGQTSLDGYLFCWSCTNGQIDTRNSSGVWTRRGHSAEEAVYEWARAAVDGILGGLEPALDAVEALTHIPVAGEANDVLRDVFTRFRVPVAERARIITNVIDTSGELTMYAILAAITQVANDPELDPAHVDNILRMGGDFTHAAAERCTSCRRLMPHE